MPIVASAREKATITAKVTAKLVQPSIGSMIDQLHTLREKKRDLEAQIATVEGEYKAVEETLLEALDKQKIDASRGSMASCSITKTVVGNITDYDALCKYVKRTGYFHLFQRRLTDTAVRELLEAGKTIPGVEPFTKRRLNLRSL